MANLTNSHSLTEFQRHARSFIEVLNETREPMLLTVNGKVQAVLVDPATFQALEQQQERQRFIEALREGEEAIKQGRVRPAEQAYEEMKSKYGF
jgi:PHD/YefM family antitoxin component YafN of YafNO toxin-antitoxin module